MAQSSSSSGSSAGSSGDEEEVVRPLSKNPAAPLPAPPRNSSKPATPASAPISKPPSKSSAPASAPISKPPSKSSAPDSESSSSDDEEGEESSGSEDSASDTDNNDAKAPHPPVRPTAATTTMEHSDSGSTDDDSGSDDDSESSDEPPQPLRSSPVKALATKPLSEPAKPQKPGKKKLKPQEASPDHEGGGLKTRPLIWNEEDEIALLRSMVDYYAKKGRVPSASNVDAFREFVKESLSVDASKNQIWDKIRRLKRKHAAATARGMDGLKASFSKPHDRTAFVLSKQIWVPKAAVLFGNGGRDEHAEDDAARKHMKIKDEHLVARRQHNHGGDTTNSSGVAADADGDLAEMEGKYPYPLRRQAAEAEGKYSYPLLRQAASYTGSRKRSAYIAMEAVVMVDSSKAATIKEKYKKLIVSEMKNNFRRMELLKESAKLFMDAIEKMD